MIYCTEKLQSLNFSYERCVRSGHFLSTQYTVVNVPHWDKDFREQCARDVPWYMCEDAFQVTTTSC